MPKRPAKSSPPGPSAHLLRSQFAPSELHQRFLTLFSPALILAWLKDCPADFRQRLFTPLITLWCMIFQRLAHDHSLSAVVADAHLGRADALSPEGKMLSRRIKSTATTSFSDARQRLPLPLLHSALAHTAREIRAGAKSDGWKGWNVVLLDGSTVRLRSLGDIPKVFHPHRSSHGVTYWCLMRVVAGFCLQTGVAVATAMASASVGEQALAIPLLARLGPKSLVVADRNFGIFSVVQAALDASAQVVIRLTAARARKLARDNGCILPRQLDRPARWTASRHDKVNAESPHQTVAGRLLVCPVDRRGFRPQAIYLFTTLTDDSLHTPADLLALYGRRWQVELDLRFVKTEMELGALECKSAEMARKEWVAGLLAYNLIRSLMVAAGARANLSIRGLSFSRTRQFLEKWFDRHAWHSGDGAALWHRLVGLVARCRQPRRRKPRPAEPRAKRYCKQDFPMLRGSRALARKTLKMRHMQS